MEENRPQLAFTLTVIAGFLILVEGALLLIVGNAASSGGYSVAGALLSGIAELGISLGLLVLVLAVSLWSYPEAHGAIGALIIAASIASFFGGGGFFVGIPIGVFGGILAIVFESSEEEQRAGVLLPRESAPPPVTCWNCARPWKAGAAACPECGAYPRA
jgi:hypothetical protein